MTKYLIFIEASDTKKVMEVLKYKYHIKTANVGAETILFYLSWYPTCIKSEINDYIGSQIITSVTIQTALQETNMHNEETAPIAEEINAEVIKQPQPWEVAYHYPNGYIGNTGIGYIDNPWEVAYHRREKWLNTLTQATASEYGLSINQIRNFAD